MCINVDKPTSSHLSEMIVSQVDNFLWSTWTFDRRVREGEQCVASLEVPNVLPGSLHQVRRVVRADVRIVERVREAENLLEVQLDARGHDQIVIVQTGAIAKDELVLFGLNLHHSTAKPVCLARYHLLHRLVRVLQLLETATDQREQRLIVVPLCAGDSTMIA